VKDGSRRVLCRGGPLDRGKLRVYGDDDVSFFPYKPEYQYVLSNETYRQGGETKEREVFVWTMTTESTAPPPPDSPWGERGLNRPPEPKGQARP
jgi:hypothetical protein